MRNPEHEMFNSRQVLAYDSKKRCYYYRDSAYHNVDNLIPALYEDAIGGVGITYSAGKSTLDFSLSVEDNETTVFSLNGKEWEPYQSFSQVPNALQFAIFIETVLAAIQIFKGER